MSYEISRLDIADRQLLAKPNVSIWTDIGEAEITYTFFGKARVRIIHKHDKIRRTILLSTIGVVVVIAVIWQGWVAFQQNESLQSAESVTPQRPSIEVIEPAPLPVYTLHSATPQPVKNKPRAPLPTEVGQPTNSQNSATQTPLGLKPADKMVAKPVTQQPSITIKPQSAPVATNTFAPNNQIDKPLARRPLPSMQTVGTAVAATPAAATAASSPAAVTPHVAPLLKDSGSTPLRAGDKLLADPINMQGK